MKIYKVGGCVRDEILGITPKDYDYVVVGSSPQEMVSLGYSQVGKDFPVFLHPTTGEEYALARTERKVGVGYNGFESSWEGVTLEEDLARRDLTMNSMAKDLDTGEIIDPFGGRFHLKNKQLHATSNSFAEDPIRVLRVGRFLARHPDFTVAPSLKILSKEIAPEIHECSPERIWKEIEKSLSEVKPSRFFEWMSNFNTFPILHMMSLTPQKEEHHPEIWVDVHTYLVMDYAAKHYGNPEVVFACLCHDFGKPSTYVDYGNAYGHEEAGLDIINKFCDQWKVPNNYRELALMTSKYHTKIHGCLGRGVNKGMKAKSIMKLFEETNALGKTHRFVDMLYACLSDARGRGKDRQEQLLYEIKEYPQARFMQECLMVAKMVDTKSISLPAKEAGLSGIKIGEKIRTARIAAIKQVQQTWEDK